MGTLDVNSAKNQFFMLVDAISASHLPSFTIWLDAKLAEYKTIGQLKPDSQSEQLTQYPEWIAKSFRQNLSFLFPSPAPDEANLSRELLKPTNETAPRKRSSCARPDTTRAPKRARATLPPPLQRDPNALGNPECLRSDLNALRDPTDTESLRSDPNTLGDLKGAKDLRGNLNALRNPEGTQDLPSSPNFRRDPKSTAGQQSDPNTLEAPEGTGHFIFIKQEVPSSPGEDSFGVDERFDMTQPVFPHLVEAKVGVLGGSGEESVSSDHASIENRDDGFSLQNEGQSLARAASDSLNSSQPTSSMSGVSEPSHAADNKSFPFVPPDSAKAIITRAHRGKATFALKADDILEFKQPNGKYRCPACGKETRDINDYRKHSVSHTHEKAFMCPYCPQRFGAQSSCYIHQRTRHPDLPQSKVQATVKG